MLKRFLASMLITTTHKTVFDGASGVLELNLKHYNLLSKTRATEMKVPQFVYDEFLQEAKARNIKQTDSYAGVKISPSDNNRFEFK